MERHSSVHQSISCPFHFIPPQPGHARISFKGTSYTHNNNKMYPLHLTTFICGSVLNLSLSYFGLKAKLMRGEEIHEISFRSQHANRSLLNTHTCGCPPSPRLGWQIWSTHYHSSWIYNIYFISNQWTCYVQSSHPAADATTLASSPPIGGLDRFCICIEESN